MGLCILTIRRSTWFDARWYLAEYPDVAAAGIDPARHYVLHGHLEGRDPGPRFSTRDYLYQHDDVAAAGVNPLWHYERHGRLEGRLLPAKGAFLLAGGAGLSLVQARRLAEAKAAFRESSLARLSEFLSGGARIRLPRAQAPRVSIVLVLYNQAELTLQCLESLAATLAEDVEVLLVDNASSDRTPELLARIDGARIVPQAENLHFVRGANAGAGAALGQYLLFLNNDTLARPGAVAAAAALLDAQATVGAVGGKLLQLDGTVQEAGCIAWSDGTTAGYARGSDPQAPALQFRRDVDYCSGAFLMVRRALFEQLGGFDLAYVPAYYEDTDLCARIYEAGYRVVYEPGVEIVHLEHGSVAAPEQLAQSTRPNRERYARRHGGALPDAARTRDDLALRMRPSAAAKVLFIDDQVPIPSLGGGLPRAYALVLELLGAGAFVTHYPLNWPQVDMAQAYAALPREVEIAAQAGRAGLADFLRSRVGYYDLLIVSRPHNMAFVRDVARQVPAFFARMPVVYDAEALYCLREAARAALVGGALPAGGEDGVETQALRSELALAAGARTVLAVSRREAQYFIDAGCADVRVLGHTLVPAPAEPGFAARRDILFVGRLLEADSPNAESLRWFVREVMPRLAGLLEEACTLHIVGACAPELAHELAGDGIVLHGRVEDLATFHAQARLFVAPTRYAAGIAYKVHEAAARGLPIVASSPIAGQLEWRDGEHLLAADSAEQFARACARLYREPDLWNRLRDAALERVRDDCAPERFRRVVRDLLENSAAGPGRAPS